jgi:hypothetical protein
MQSYQAEIEHYITDLIEAVSLRFPESSANFTGGNGAPIFEHNHCIL